MTDEEKAIERCNQLIKVEHSNWIGISNQKAIETVLNLIKTQQEEIKKKDGQIQVLMNRTKNLNKECQQHFDNMMDTIKENSEKDKIIDEMVKYISDLDIDEDICMKNVVNAEICNEEYSNCKECIKEYFINKVEKENKDE